MHVLDLTAFSAHSHHLNATADDETIARFRARPFLEQCAIAAAWASGVDHRVDVALHALNDDTWGS